MSTLPPEGNNDEQSAGAEPGGPTPPPVPPQTPGAPTPPPAPPGSQQPGYQAPPQPGYEAPPQQPGYQAPPPGGYQQPGAYQQPAAADPASNITLNYWLSVFFAWIPALIFYLIEKDKGHPLAYAYHRDNLNFALVRTGLGLIIALFAWIPYLGWLIAIVGWLGSIVLFIFHIIAAAKSTADFRSGAKPPFIFNIPLVK